jgi:hypothetical protein
MIWCGTPVKCLTQNMIAAQLPVCFFLFYEDLAPAAVMLVPCLACFRSLAVSDNKLQWNY